MIKRFLMVYNYFWFKNCRFRIGMKIFIFIYLFHISFVKYDVTRFYVLLPKAVESPNRTLSTPLMHRSVSHQPSLFHTCSHSLPYCFRTGRSSTGSVRASPLTSFCSGSPCMGGVSSCTILHNMALGLLFPARAPFPAL